MAKRKATKRVGGPDDVRLHRRQLFHWIGRDLEQDRSLTVACKTEKYLQYLKQSLVNGLWLNLPEKPDNLGTEADFRITHSICCFTETSVREIADHTREYGCLGFGFPKRFVVSNGGMPVHYSSDANTHPAFSSWTRLNRLLSDRRVVEALDDNIRDELQTEFEYVTQFLKRMKEPRSKPIKTGSKRPSKNKPAFGSKKTTVSRVSRNFGDTLPYLEEREWRIVVKQRQKRIWPKNAVKNNADEKPDWFLPYKVGHDLFTIVVPDNRTLSAVMHDEHLPGLLFSPTKPPVTLLSLTDVGTF